jgi:hypothetical protein
MAEKLAVYAARAGVDNVPLLLQAYHLALKPRLEQLSDVFHHDLLHPARCALILLENVQHTNAVVLAAAQVTETRAPELRVAGADIAHTLGDDVARLSVAVPDPVRHADTLLEKLVTAEEDVALIALAERLDQSRHLHMRARSEWRDYYTQTVTAYLPVAERVHPELARRFQRWADAFLRRLD